MNELIVGKVFIENPEGKILLLRRSKTAPRRALEWDLPGGWVEPGEEPLTACVREVLEESGLVAEDAVEVLRKIEETDTGKLTRIYAKARVSSSAVKLSYEHDKYLWVDNKEYFELMTHKPQVEAFRAIYNKQVQ